MLLCLLLPFLHLFILTISFFSLPLITSLLTQGHRWYIVDTLKNKNNTAQIIIQEMSLNRSRIGCKVWNTAKYKGKNSIHQVNSYPWIVIIWQTSLWDLPGPRISPFFLWVKNRFLYHLVILPLLFQHIPGNFQTKDIFSQLSQAVIKPHSSTSWSHPIASLFLCSIVPVHDVFR